MVTSRTGTADWKRRRAYAIKCAQEAGVTRCMHCGVALDYERGRRPNSAEVDHVDAFSKTLSNAGRLNVICRRCNQSKGDRAAPKISTVMAVRPLKVSRQW